MDVRMPGLSGFEATRSILAQRSDARIVIVTNYNEPDLRHAAAESGAIGLVLKENLEEIRPLLLNHSAEQQSASTGQPQDIPTVNNPVLRVLMAEDSPLDCELICLRLTDCGYTPVVERVCCEAEMRAALERARWDIVFTDHGLPGFSGLAALDLLRKMRLQTPALCVTGSIDPIVIGQILEAGAFACVNKDDLSTLCATVEHALNRRLPNTPFAPSASAQTQTDSNAPTARGPQPDPHREDGGGL
jgi:CheY-like chemotaxis protein